MLNVILVIHSLIALALIGVVLLQKSEGGALGIGGGGGAFFATSIALAIYAGAHRAPSSVVDQPTPATESQPAAPAQPAVPRSQ
jgi:preprotein translocase subunit SecG